MAGHATTVARPYAEAVFGRARETGRLGEWSDTLQFLAVAMREPALVAFVTDPKLTPGAAHPAHARRRRGAARCGGAEPDQGPGRERPPRRSSVMGHMDKTSVGDPSNAPEGYPPRSESGWPLIYPGVHWDGFKWAGEPTGQARFHCGESSYGTEDQALAEARRIAASKGAPVDPGWAKAHENRKKPRKPKAPVEPPEEPL